jgi:hypothetical protein
MLKKNIINAWLLTAMFSITGIIALPAHAGDVSAQELARTNNPLASMKIFNLHNYYTSGWTGLPDETANTFRLRYAQPVGKFLMRASLPFPTLPVTGQVDSESGMGDLNAFATYLAVSKPEMTFGLLHGVGFAGALADVGLPQHEIPLALLLFSGSVSAQDADDTAYYYNSAVNYMNKGYSELGKVANKLDQNKESSATRHFNRALKDFNKAIVSYSKAMLPAEDKPAIDALKKGLDALQKSAKALEKDDYVSAQNN